MSNAFAPVQLDSYKVGHPFQYPDKTQMVYSNFTCRKSRDENIKEVVFFGLQPYMMKYLTDEWNNSFFDQPKEDVIARYKRRMDTHLGPDSITTAHLEKLHDLGYMPVSIRAIPEGTLVPISVPCLTIRNLHNQVLTNRDGSTINGNEFYWVTNMLETSLSCSIWFPIVNATKALNNRRILERYADATCMNRGFVPFQNHDFSMRGHQCMEAAAISGAAHILSSVGSDTIPGIEFLETYYNADASKEMIAVSVPATEHSVMCAGGSNPDEEQETFRRLIQDEYPTGIVSIVSDTWDLWNVLETILPNLKDIIMQRDGKVVIRPDSGNPVDIICGNPKASRESERKGLVECLWDIFGGITNDKGYNTLDSHIGAIYGDGINDKRMEQILSRLEKKGFASDNIVFGIGSFTYSFGISRDTYNAAIKSVAVQIDGEYKAIFKDPITDDGTKKSAKGFCAVLKDQQGNLFLKDNVSFEESQNDEMKEVFNGSKGGILVEHSLSEIRERMGTQFPF